MKLLFFLTIILNTLVFSNELKLECTTFKSQGFYPDNNGFTINTTPQDPGYRNMDFDGTLIIEKNTKNATWNTKSKGFYKLIRIKDTFLKDKLTYFSVVKYEGSVILYYDTKEAILTVIYGHGRVAAFQKCVPVI